MITHLISRNIDIRTAGYVEAIKSRLDKIEAFHNEIIFYYREALGSNDYDLNLDVFFDLTDEIVVLLADIKGTYLEKFVSDVENKSNLVYNSYYNLYKRLYQIKTKVQEMNKVTQWRIDDLADITIDFAYEVRIKLVDPQGNDVPLSIYKAFVGSNLDNGKDYYSDADEDYKGDPNEAYIFRFLKVGTYSFRGVFDDVVDGKFIEEVQLNPEGIIVSKEALNEKGFIDLTLVTPYPVTPDVLK